MSLLALLWPQGLALSAPALLVLGMATSPHCALMCGALSVHQARAGAALRPGESLLWTQGGRIAGYTVAGALAGALGQTLLRVLPAAWIGEAVRVAAAIAVIAIGIHTLWHLSQPAVGCCHPAGTVRRARGPLRLLLFLQGSAWALIPCGLLYSVLLLAALSATAASGALLTGAFALGSSPLLAAIGWSGPHWRNRRVEGMLSGGWLIALGTAGLLTILPEGAVGLPAWCAAHL